MLFARNGVKALSPSWHGPTWAGLQLQATFLPTSRAATLDSSLLAISLSEMARPRQGQQADGLKVKVRKKNLFHQSADNQDRNPRH